VDHPINETFGQRVGRLRGVIGWTQEELAAKAEVPVGSVRNYEYDHRRPRADAALRLARALGVTLEVLLSVPSSKPARAKVQDSPTVRVLKRAWARATGEERKKFLKFANQDGDHTSQAEGAAATKTRISRNVMKMNSGKKAK